MKTNTILKYRPRVLIPWNTGTRVILSKRDKMRSRRYLNRIAKESY